VGLSWCPKCGAELLAPSVYSSDWRCAEHGPTLPLSIFARRDAAALEHIRERAEVPLWVPDPVPLGWTLSGLAAVGDDRSRFRATVVACQGPAPLGGEGEWLIVAEEPGVGLGSSYARSSTTDARTLSAGVAAAKIHALGHPTSLWPVLDTVADRSAYVGEADGVWLWLISFPADAGYAVLEDLAVTDVRHRAAPSIGTGPLSRRLRPGN